MNSFGITANLKFSFIAAYVAAAVALIVSIFLNVSYPQVVSRYVSDSGIAASSVPRKSPDFLAPYFLTSGFDERHFDLDRRRKA